MAEVQTLAVEPRDKAGKGSARAARREGLVPAVIYGGKKAPMMVIIKKNELIRLINRGGFMSSRYELHVSGKKEQVLPRDVQTHPVTDMPLHVDFLRLSKGQTISVNIPVEFVGEEESPGIERGGILSVVRHDIELNVPATDIPDNIVISVAGMEINDSVKISDITLPEGCEPTITDRDFTIASISAPTLEPEPEEEEEPEELEAVEGEEGEVEEMDVEGEAETPAKGENEGAKE